MIPPLHSAALEQDGFRQLQTFSTSIVTSGQGDSGDVQTGRLGFIITKNGLFLRGNLVENRLFEGHKAALNSSTRGFLDTPVQVDGRTKDRC